MSQNLVTQATWAKELEEAVEAVEAKVVKTKSKKLRRVVEEVYGRLPDVVDLEPIIGALRLLAKIERATQAIKHAEYLRALLDDDEDEEDSLLLMLH